MPQYSLALVSDSVTGISIERQHPRPTAWPGAEISITKLSFLNNIANAFCLLINLLLVLPLCPKTTHLCHTQKFKDKSKCRDQLSWAASFTSLCIINIVSRHNWQWKWSRQNKSNSNTPIQWKSSRQNKSNSNTPMCSTELWLKTAGCHKFERQ